jgi:hypothetical protein
MAANAITWMNTMRNINSADERYGSLRFCSGTSCTIPSAISTEHNADAYSAYFWRGKLENNQAYISNANLIKDYITKEMWAPSASSNGIHTANVFWRGYNDYAYCTDPQAWTVLSLGLAGNSGEEFYKSLDWLYYSPYGNTKSLQDYSPSVLDVDGFKSCTEQLTNFIWIEGTEQSALAFKLINKTRGDYFHNQMNRIPVTNYGKIYSFSETSPTNLRYMENWRYNSVAGTAWNYFYARNINPFVPPNSEYWVSTVVNGNNIENKIYYRNHHFLSILQNNGSFVLRPHPGIDVDGWGSSLYMQPFFPGATLKNSNVESITISNDGVNVITKGKVSRSTSLTYGDWNFNMKFSYKPDSREIFGNGDYSIVLSGAMNSLTSDLNLYKIASNYLDNVPLLGGGIGDTGDMEYADYLVDSSGGRWTPPLQPGHFPSESGKYISVDVSGDYYNVDTVRQGYNYIKPAYKPSLKIELSSSSNVPINFGAIYNTAGATQFWLDNVGITPIVKSSYTGTTYNFNSKFYSKALPGDGTAIK